MRGSMCAAGVRRRAGCVERALVVARLEYPELSAEAGSRLLLAAADALKALRHERELICRFERDEFD